MSEVYRDIYLVTYNGYCDSYGVYVYALGIFDTEEGAKFAIKSALSNEIKVTEEDYKLTEEDFKITKLPLNLCRELTFDGYASIETDAFLGGYAE